MRNGEKYRLDRQLHQRDVWHPISLSLGLSFFDYINQAMVLCLSRDQMPVALNIKSSDDCISHEIK